MTTEAKVISQWIRPLLLLFVPLIALFVYVAMTKEWSALLGLVAVPGALFVTPPKLPASMGGERGMGRAGVLIVALSLGAAALVWAPSCTVNQREADAIHTGVSGGMSVGCDVLTDLFPDNAWVSAGCELGKIVAVNVLALALSLDEEGVSKAVQADVFAAEGSPTVHLGCGALALRCHRAQRAASGVFCGAALARCDLGASTVADVVR